MELCSDVPSTRISGTGSARKNGGESWLGAARRWLIDQANGWCSVGLCSNGRCEGHLSNISVSIVQDGPEDCTFEFSADISCSCPPATETAPTPVGAAPPLTAAQQRQAVDLKLRLLMLCNELIAQPVPEPELSAFKAIRESTKQWLLVEITALTPTDKEADKFWKELFDFLVAAGIGHAVEKIIGGVAGTLLGPLVHIFLDPTPIGGVDTQVIDTLTVHRPPDHCYRITWYRTKYSDEIWWGPVRIKIEKVPCE